MPVVKKSVAIHPLLDKAVRGIWAMLIKAGYDATYSMALNFILLGAATEAVKEGGWSDETVGVVWNFIEDRKTIEELNLREQLESISEKLQLEYINKARKILKTQ